jgi:hypothetical protein
MAQIHLLENTREQLQGAISTSEAWQSLKYEERPLQHIGTINAVREDA